MATKSFGQKQKNWRIIDSVSDILNSRSEDGWRVWWHSRQRETEGCNSLSFVKSTWRNQGNFEGSFHVPCWWRAHVLFFQTLRKSCQDTSLTTETYCLFSAPTISTSSTLLMFLEESTKWFELVRCVSFLRTFCSWWFAPKLKLTTHITSIPSLKQLSSSTTFRRLGVRISQRNHYQLYCLFMWPSFRNVCPSGELRLMLLVWQPLLGVSHNQTLNYISPKSERRLQRKLLPTWKVSMVPEGAEYFLCKYGSLILSWRTAYAVVANGDEISVVIAGLNTNLRNYW